MGCTQSKTQSPPAAKDRSAATEAPAQSTDNTAYPAGVKPLDAVFATEDAAGIDKIKRWAKEAKAKEGIQLLETVLFVEAVYKRRSVYVSAKKCGDDEETVQERAQGTATNIVDTFLVTGAAKHIGAGFDQDASLGLREWVEQSRNSSSAGHVDFFDTVVRQVVARWEQTVRR
ncbi:hypothetical protein RI367_003208 [Sorochytrium milnesiophthora]